ncbi:MAG: hypothetical protein NZ528_13650 [Caldilineales bacterium]|nr:hypothetical protein [Caldilineales bacterium]MDW8316815.1 hypothetical protein [Anaerolineae bacterium]
MSTPSHQALADQYAQGVQSLLTTPTKARGKRSAATPEALAQRADNLASVAAALSQETAAHLDDLDPDVRLGAEQHLLAQAVANLAVADYLMAAAAQAGEVEGKPPSRRSTRALPDPAPALDVLATPLAEAGAALSPRRTVGRPAASTATREELLAAVDQAIEAVVAGAAANGRDALAGILGLDLALLRQAASMVSQELAQLVQRVSEEGFRLLSKAVAFVVQAYDNLLAALGQEVTGEMRRFLADWLEQLRQGEALAGLLAALFETAKVQDRVRSAVEASSASPVVLGQVRSAVAALPQGFAARTRLVGQILAGLGVLKRIPAARLPAVEAAVAATYVGLLGYVLFVGGDYVDAPRLERLGRVPGVAQTVEVGLQGNPL